MGFGPAYGTGGSGGAVDIFIQKDGSPAIYANTGARDTYFQSNPDELAKLKASGNAVGIGTTNQITAAYIYEQSQWKPIATNFKGDKGTTGQQGAPGAGIDPSKMKDKSIPVWDSTLQTFIDSGVGSEASGELLIAPSSISFGNHQMSSSVENVVFRNLHTHRIYSPVWQEVAPGESKGYLRSYDSSIVKVVRVPAGNIDVTNPTNAGIVIDKDEIFLGGKFTLSQPATAVMLEIFDTLDGTLVWRKRLGDLAAGTHNVTFEIPFDVRAGYTYDVKLLSEDGSDVIAKSNASTGFSWEINRALWSDKTIANEDWVNGLDRVKTITESNGVITITDKDDAVSTINLPNSTLGVKDLTLLGSTLTVRYDDDTTSNITLPSTGTGVAAKNDVNLFMIDADYTITASDILDKPSYFIYTGSGTSNITLPDIDDIPIGQNVVLYVDNVTASALLFVKVANDEKIYPLLTTLVVPKNETVAIVSDKGNNLWHTINMDRAGGGSTGPVGTYVTNVQTASNGSELVIYYSDNTNSTISIDAAASDIAKLAASIATLKNQIKAKTKFFVYHGSTVPTVPTGARGGYYLTFYNLAGNLSVSTPITASNIGDGTTLFIDNNDTNYAINLTVPSGTTIDGKAAYQVPANTASWFIRNGNDWQVLYSGYLPDSYKHLLSEIKATMLSDDAFLKDVQLQGDDPNTVLDCTSLEFPDAQVKADPNDALRGIIEFPAQAGKGVSFVNQDGSVHSNTKFKLVGMEIVDPGDGTPPKLVLLGNHNVPTPTQADAYAFFSDSPTAPDTLNFNSLPLFRGGRVTVHKTNTDPEYVYILLPPGQVEATERIGELGGLPAYWSKEAKNYPVNGQPREYEVFRSPYPFHESDVTFVLYP